MNKRAQWDVFWLEYVAGAVLVLSFYLAARGAYIGMAYVVALLTGAILGKFWYERIRKKKSLLPVTVCTLGVLLGIILGSIGTDRRVVVIAYLIGLGLSYSAHAEKWIKTA